MLLHDARRATRVGAAGELVPLEEQDRSRWRRDAIAEGLAVLDAALALRRRGPYQLQAAIAALHARAARADQTDWKQIAALYGGLLQEQPNAVVELNAADLVVVAGSDSDVERSVDRIGFPVRWNREVPGHERRHRQNGRPPVRSVLTGTADQKNECDAM